MRVFIVVFSTKKKLRFIEESEPSQEIIDESKQDVNQMQSD